MDEGKPTRAKWWSRPRPQASAGQQASTDEGDFELAQPAASTQDGTAPADPAGESPSASAEPTNTATLSDTGDTGADAQAHVHVHSGDGDGDYELRRPAGEAVSAADPVAFGPVGQADSVPSAQEAPELASPVADSRPKPLHDPDPYSTPPYGEPGPWAPAPPVQHPAVAHAALPAHTDAVPVPAPVPVPVPEPSSVHADAVPPLGPPSAPAPAAEPTSTPTPGSSPWQRYDPWSATPFGGAALGGTPVGGGGRRWSRVVGGALVVAVVSGGFGGAVGAYLERNGGINGVRLPQAAAEPTGRAADSVAGIAARALPSVVTLHVSGSEESGTGTGFVLDSLGYILTNNHVVEPAGSNGEISVVFNGGQTAKAEVVGRDSGYDLAVVRVTGVKGLKPLYLGNSDNVQVGDPVVAIGAPFDLEGTVTSGIISAKERPITAGGESGDGSDVSYVDALQTDAPINPGNSGGPLLDTQGHVIGINSAIRSAADGTDSGTAQAGSIGLGFAIPINQGKRVAEELINTGKATHPVIGITLDLNYAGDGARVGTGGADGSTPVTAGGPGDRAGIRAGDVITQVDGQRVHSGEELIVKTRAHRPGDRLELTVERGGTARTLTLVLGSSGG
ncbi:putative serine protease PepD [Streptomyces sp. yr375]|uniref:S1C family serine protease n=1 Tax=Streptomyces sp. yr375 TaxID=1761906 RepID=UPI0008C17FE0|nr:trypsin-like peptidase domain-containing protein [Streptomyces sp. yr375]SES25826.1 putative serine protease PepD [Streptomyces sp. yr375]